MTRLLEHLDDVPMDSTHVVSIEERKEKRSARQLKLYWKLMRELANSGKGGRDTPEGFDEECKYRWTMPILLADNDFIGDLWQSYRVAHPGKEAVLPFVQQVIHNSDLNTKQMAEVLDSIYRYYEYHGVALTHPEDLQLLEY